MNDNYLYKIQIYNHYKIYHFYLKEDIELKPFVIDYSKYDVLKVTDNLRTYYPGWSKHFPEEKRTVKKLDFIDDLIQAHFAKSAS